MNGYESELLSVKFRELHRLLVKMRVKEPAIFDPMALLIEEIGRLGKIFSVTGDDEDDDFSNPQ